MQEHSTHHTSSLNSNEPVIIFKNLSIPPSHSTISGEYIILDVSWDMNFNPITKRVFKKGSFSLENKFQYNFHQMLKMYAENLVFEYFITKTGSNNRPNNFVYDYNKRSLELRADNTPNADLGFVGNTVGIYYASDATVREMILQPDDKKEGEEGDKNNG